ncbi:YybS family protein [Aquibacillus sediminis]|uniref:YybS family protein n=1 Tax=Aquibacillus sediminis TaxID=2574734 RepID=UPI001107C4A7|nr:YybS family protein [Aquibacillus sediminis]
MNNTKKVREGVIASVLFLLILLVTIFIPFLSIFSLFVLPLPFLVYTARYGWKPASILFLILLLVSTFFVAVPIAFLTGLTGLMIGSAINQQVSPYETWARGTVGYAVGIVALFLFVQVFLNINIIAEMNQTVEQSMETSEAFLSSFGLESTQEDLTIVIEQIEQLIHLLPVIIVVIAVICAFIIQYIGYKVLNWLDRYQLYFPPFRNFQLPKAMIWLYLIAIVTSWLNQDQSSMMYIVAWNVTSLAGLIIAMQGLSFVFYYTDKKKLSKAIPIITIVMIVLFPPLGLYMVRILGIIDLGFSLRERLAEK